MKLSPCNPTITDFYEVVKEKGELKDLRRKRRKEIDSFHKTKGFKNFTSPLSNYGGNPLKEWEVKKFLNGKLVS